GLDKSEYAPIVQKQTAASADARRISGVIAARGIAAGRAVHLRRAEMVIDEQSQGVDVEQARFDRARREMRERLSSLAVHQRGPRREILEAHLQFLDDPELIAATREGIAQGKSAAVAWQIAVRAQVRALGSLNDARLRERADDLRDVEAQLLAELTGESATLAPELPEHAIVLAKDLLPSQFVALNASRVAGICTAEGGATSHVAILAASMDIPTLVAAGPRILDVPENAELVLDAEQGWLNVSPTPAELQHAKDSVARHRARLAEDLSHAQRECFTSDGVRIHIYANAGSLAEARAAVAHGAEGCGLLRTEFLFLDRATAPDEREQATQYARIAATFGGRPVAIRTLDVGGDKPLRYLPLAAEENPALGVRGIRASLLHPQLLRTQLRAILGAAASGECRILLPMVTDADEIRAVRAMLAELQQEMKLEKRVPLGAMIETPAAALMAEQIAREADFLSIGTNDLTQYTLAVDRGNAALADRLDALHPAVLRLISRVARAAEERRRELAVCGGLASDPEATPILIGLGVRELSMVTAAIPRQKSFIRSLNSVDCAALAREALQLEDAGSVRSLVQRWLAARAAAPVAAMEVSS
ncbi:MAG TPA: phosphoenolpyruvate--protein phosphotransferase, partial [Steroidobacteraceae bacterium]